jgi:hypothetical protein
MPERARAGTRTRGARRCARATSLALLGAVALTAAGCGSGRSATPAATHLEREDFAAVSRALARAAGSFSSEVAATKAAWPAVANGLPSTLNAGSRAAMLAAQKSASSLRLPALLGEVRSASLTGPAAHIAGLARSYLGLAARGWQMILAAVAAGDHGPPGAARFARANVPLYIESVYDGHFTLAQIGKQLLAGYRELGGAAAFGSLLGEAEVGALAQRFSEANDRLHPHVGVRLGS